MDFNSILPQYIFASKKSKLFDKRSTCNLVYETNSSMIQPYGFLTLNEAGVEIMARINGEETVRDYLAKLKREKDISEKVFTDIVLFLVDMLEKGILALSETPIEDGAVFITHDEMLPSHASIELTDRCNLRCKHCYINASPDKHDTMTLEQFKSLANILASQGVVYVELTGGELLTNPDIYEILCLALERFNVVAILTNGTLLDNKMLELLKLYKNKILVSVSLDFPDSSRHDEFRGKPGAWGLAVKAIKELSDAGIVTRAACTIMDENMWDIEDVIRLSVDNGAKHFGFSFIDTFGRASTYKGKIDRLSQEEAVEYFEYLNEVIERNRDVIGIKPIEERSVDDTSENCGAGTRTIAIDPKGNIRTCNLCRRTISLGNVFTDAYDDMFHTSLTKFIQQLPAPSQENGCQKDCPYFGKCYGCIVRGIEYSAKLGKCCAWIMANDAEDLFRKYVSDEMGAL